MLVELQIDKSDLQYWNARTAHWLALKILRKSILTLSELWFFTTPSHYIDLQEYFPSKVLSEAETFLEQGNIPFLLQCNSQKAFQTHSEVINGISGIFLKFCFRKENSSKNVDSKWAFHSGIILCLVLLFIGLLNSDVFNLISRKTPFLWKLIACCRPIYLHIIKLHRHRFIWELYDN